MLIVAVTRLAAELSQPCRTGTEVLLPGEQSGCRHREGRAGLCCAAARNATGCAGVRETPRVGAAPGPRAACLGFHWSRGGAGRGANMTLKILIEMKRCSEGAHSSAHSARPTKLTASAAAARPRPQLRPRLREMLSHSSAVPPRAAGGSSCVNRRDWLLEMTVSVHF